MRSTKMNFDPSATISHIEKRLNKPPRKVPRTLLKNFVIGRPAWAKGKDKTRKIYDCAEETIQRGEIRWATVIQANQAVFQPGNNTSGAQVLYDATGESDLQDLTTAADKCFSTKLGERSNDEELKLGEMLADEMERALDWPIPRSIAMGKEMFTSIAMLPRQIVPYRFLAVNHFPILTDPVTRLVLLIPETYWDDDFKNAWKREAIKTILVIKQEK